MGWTKEEFIKWCSKAGVNPADALREGKIDVRSPEIKAKDAVRKAYGAEKTNKKIKRQNQKRRSDEIKHITKGIQNPVIKPDTALALGKAIQQPATHMDDPNERIRIHVTGLRVRPIDPDNFAGGCKALIDGIVASGIIARDNWQTIEVSFSQEKVSTWLREGTLVEIEFPLDSPREIA
jgi:hypothetical protein